MLQKKIIKLTYANNECAGNTATGNGMKYVLINSSI